MRGGSSISDPPPAVRVESLRISRSARGSAWQARCTRTRGAPAMKSPLLHAALAAALCAVTTRAQDAVPSAEVVLRELKAGNDHHVGKKYAHPHQTAERQRELAGGQHPHAIILSCADSRVAPEIVLDQ